VVCAGLRIRSVGPLGTFVPLEGWDAGLIGSCLRSRLLARFDLLAVEVVEPFQVVGRMPSAKRRVCSLCCSMRSGHRSTAVEL
jgi:hypothetical protein